MYSVKYTAKAVNAMGELCFVVSDNSVKPVPSGIPA